MPIPEIRFSGIIAVAFSAFAVFIAARKFEDRMWRLLRLTNSALLSTIHFLVSPRSLPE